MSSFKKAIPKRKYRERSQPASRQHLGMLEKKQDYKLRALDSHKKEQELNKLRELAFNKNSDEFYYSMERTRLIGSKHRKETEEISPALQKKQKTIEGNLLTMKVQNKLSKHSQLQRSLHLIDAPAVNKHTIFVENKEKLENFNPAEHFETLPEMVSKKSNRLRKEQLQSFEIKDHEEPEGYKMLEELLKEETLLQKSLKGNILEKKIMSKDKYKIIDEDKKIYKWFRERKR